MSIQFSTFATLALMTSIVLFSFHTLHVSAHMLVIGTNRFEISMEERLHLPSADITVNVRSSVECAATCLYKIDCNSFIWNPPNQLCYCSSRMPDFYPDRDLRNVNKRQLYSIVHESQSDADGGFTYTSTGDVTTSSTGDDIMSSTGDVTMSSTIYATMTSAGDATMTSPGDGTMVTAGDVTMASVGSIGMNSLGGYTSANIDGGSVISSVPSVTSDGGVTTSSVTTVTIDREDDTSVVTSIATDATSVISEGGSSSTNDIGGTTTHVLTFTSDTTTKPSITTVVTNNPPGDCPMDHILVVLETGNRCVFVSLTTANFWNAQNGCPYGSKLVKANDQVMIGSVRYIADIQQITSEVYIGLQDIDYEGDFKWTKDNSYATEDEEQVIFTSNYLDNYNTVDLDCCVVPQNSGGSYELYLEVVSCSKQMYFACETVP